MSVMMADEIVWRIKLRAKTARIICGNVDLVN